MDPWQFSEVNELTGYYSTLSVSEPSNYGELNSAYRPIAAPAFSTVSEASTHRYNALDTGYVRNDDCILPPLDPLDALTLHKVRIHSNGKIGRAHV